MGLQLTTSDRRKSEILPKYFISPVQLVGVYDLKDQGELQGFIDLHKKFLRWLLGKYVPSYVKDLTDNAVVHSFEPWRMESQRARGGSKMWVPSQLFANFFCLRSHTGSTGENLQIEDFISQDCRKNS